MKAIYSTIEIVWIWLLSNDIIFFSGLKFILVHTFRSNTVLNKGGTFTLPIGPDIAIILQEMVHANVHPMAIAE